MDETSATPIAPMLTVQGYLIALGSNRRHQSHGLPDAVLRAGLSALDSGPLRLIAAAPIMHSRPIGPSQRHYANTAAIIETALPPVALLGHLQQLERRFGARHKRRWSARVLDLDIILWSGGLWQTTDLSIPHQAFRTRNFVLTPAAQIASPWRDPITGRTLSQLAFRNNRNANRAKRVDHGQ